MFILDLSIFEPRKNIDVHFWLQQLRPSKYTIHVSLFLTAIYDYYRGGASSARPPGSHDESLIGRTCTFAAPFGAAADFRPRAPLNIRRTLSTCLCMLRCLRNSAQHYWSTTYSDNSFKIWKWNKKRKMLYDFKLMLNTLNTFKYERSSFWKIKKVLSWSCRFKDFLSWK